MSSGPPITLQPAAKRIVRVLTWTYRREDETVRCRLALTADYSAYELQVQPPWTHVRASVELFDDALSAFERQTTIERGLLKAGFAFERVETSSELREPS